MLASLYFEKRSSEQNFPRTHRAPAESSPGKKDGVAVIAAAARDRAGLDEMSTDLALQVIDYDPSPSAEYESWLLLEPEAPPAAALPALE